MIKAVIFDMDGTIIDTEKHYARFWEEAGKRCGLPFTREHALKLRSLAIPIARGRFRDWFGAEADYEQVRNLRRELMADYLAKHEIEKKPGIEKLLEYLHKHGIKAAIATATESQKAREYLTCVGLEDAFDTVCSARMVERGKPFPDVYEFVCKQIGEDPQDCIAVEDSPNGVLSAAGAGCKTVMVPDLTQPDEVLKRYLYGVADTLEGIITMIDEE